MISFSLEKFEERIQKFMELLQKEDRPLFITSIFGKNGTEDVQDKIQSMRDIAEEYVGKYFKNKKNVVFTDGLQLLNNLCYLSQDLTHPSLEGITEIANSWGNIMTRRLLN